MCRDYTNIYPIEKTYKKDTLQNTLRIDEKTITLDHWDKEELEPLEFYHRNTTIKEKTDIGDVRIIIINNKHG